MRFFQCDEDDRSNDNDFYDNYATMTTMMIMRSTTTRPTITITITITITKLKMVPMMAVITHGHKVVDGSIEYSPSAYFSCVGSIS